MRGTGKSHSFYSSIVVFVYRPEEFTTKRTRDLFRDQLFIVTYFFKLLADFCLLWINKRYNLRRIPPFPVVYLLRGERVYNVVTHSFDNFYDNKSKIKQTIWISETTTILTMPMLRLVLLLRHCYCSVRTDVLNVNCLVLPFCPACILCLRENGIYCPPNKRWRIEICARAAGRRRRDYVIYFHQKPIMRFFLPGFSGFLSHRTALKF